jgi:uncharacterized iron-regulated membrane protein
VGFLFVGFIWNADHVPDEISFAAAVFAVFCGACLGVVLWRARRPGTWLRAKQDRFVENRNRSSMLQTLVPVAATFTIAFVLILALIAVVGLMSTTPPLAWLGFAVWTAVGVSTILDAQAEGRRMRDRYEADLEELTQLPTRPDHP